MNLQFKIITNQSQAFDGRETQVTIEITDAQIEKLVDAIVNRVAEAFDRRAGLYPPLQYQRVR